MTKAPQDTGTAVRARLLRLARERGEDFQLVLTRYVNERLLYRLAASPHGSRFVLKGAALSTLWTGEAHRATRDVDLLGFGDSSEANLRAVFAEVLALNVQDDGVQFQADSLDVGPIREDQDYGGVRIVLLALVTTAKVRLQIDVGFGDAITPDALEVDFPALLDFPAPSRVMQKWVLGMPTPVRARAFGAACGRPLPNRRASAPQGGAPPHEGASNRVIRTRL